MRANTNVAALIVAMFVFGVFTTPSGATPASNDACSVVTQDQVSADVGVSVGPGEHVMPTAVKTCTWTATDTTKGVKYVTVSFWDPKGYDGGKRLAEQMAAQSKNDKDAAPMANASASGIGDDAYYTTMGSGYSGLMVKKGNVALKIAIYGDMPIEKKKTAERAIALQALSKL
jgi:hypothetical protein